MTANLVLGFDIPFGARRAAKKIGAKQAEEPYYNSCCQIEASFQ